MKFSGKCSIDNAWNESEGNRGSNGIGTCLVKFMKLIKEYSVEKFSFYFDNYKEQNKNRYIYFMWG